MRRMVVVLGKVDVLKLPVLQDGDFWLMERCVRAGVHRCTGRVQAMMLTGVVEQPASVLRLCCTFCCSQPRHPSVPVQHAQSGGALVPRRGSRASSDRLDAGLAPQASSAGASCALVGACTAPVSKRRACGPPCVFACLHASATCVVAGQASCTPRCWLRCVAKRCPNPPLMTCKPCYGPR